MRTLYQEELDYLFSRKALCVRGALVISAFVEGQIWLLAEPIFEKEGVIPKPRGQYSESIRVLKRDNVLSPQELKQIEGFRTERNIAFHAIFKGMTRGEWVQQNNKVVELGRPIVQNLDKKLDLLKSD